MPIDIPNTHFLVRWVGDGFDAVELFLDQLERAVDGIVEEQARLIKAMSIQGLENDSESDYRTMLFEEVLPRNVRYSALLQEVTPRWCELDARSA